MMTISTNYKLLLIAAVTLGVFLPGQASGEDKTKAVVEEGFVSLFDGKTLAGWEGNEKIFRVEDGAIIGGNLKEPIKNNEFLASNDRYGDFELRLDAKLIGQGENAGVQFRSERMPDHFEVIGYQCDIGTAAGKSIWGSLYDESRRRKFLASGDHEKLAKVVKAGEWNPLTVRCEGAHIQIWVGDLLTVDYTEEDDKIERTGRLALQIHSGPPTEAWYKNIRIKSLEKK